MVAVILVSTISLNATVGAAVDARLAASLSALAHSVDRYRGIDAHGPRLQTGADEVTAFIKPLADFVGQGAGTVIALGQAGRVVDAASFSDSGGTELPSGAVRALQDRAAAGAGTSEIELPALGRYRVAVQERPDGGYLVSAVSLALTDEAEARQTITSVVVALLALAVAIASAAMLGKFLFRSMERVVGVAETVAGTPLDSADSGIAVRVGAPDADPRTDIGKLGEAMNRLLEHVDSALAVRAATDRRMRRFVTDASHELRTPLAAIQGYAELTRQESELLPETTEYALARIEAEAKRMSSLVGELLLLARLDEGHDLQIEEIDLADLVATAVNDARASNPLHDWHLDVPETRVPVLGDRERLHQLVVSVLANAGTHTPPGTTVLARIAAGADRGDRVELTVSDTGPGISDAMLPVLFERFVRADSARTRQNGGTGLGLAIAQSIVEAHGGTIAVSSGPAGATFSVLLPHGQAAL